MRPCFREQRRRPSPPTRELAQPSGSRTLRLGISQPPFPGVLTPQLSEVLVHAELPLLRLPCKGRVGPRAPGYSSLLTAHALRGLGPQTHAALHPF